MSVTEKLDFDKEALKKNGAQWLIGIDEVGWGAFAGDIVIGAVAIPSNFYQDEYVWAQIHPLLSKVNDSKAVRPKLRVELAETIKQKFRFGFGYGKVAVINKDGPVAAYKNAFEEALNKAIMNIITIENRHEGSKYHVLLDGDKSVDSTKFPQQELVVKGDSKSFAIASASLVAKVQRDQMMTEMSKTHPHYDWENNVGYGTPKHREALKKYGACDAHRTQYVRSTIQG